MPALRLVLGADHAGFQLKNQIAEWLKSQGHDVHDYGTHSDQSTDYPDYAHPVASDVENGKADFGILVCGSGNGINMTANKHQGIRSALCWNKEVASLARQHNNANCIALPARFISTEEALECVKIFISTDFEGGRHANRVNKIACA